MTENGSVKMAEGTFTEELIEEMRQKKGLKLRVENALFNEEVTKGAVRRFVDGIGDVNPLYRDQSYAAKTRYGSVVAPPSFVFSVLAGVQFGWRGLAGFHSASEMEFYKPMKLNDKIRPEETFKDFEGPKASQFAGRMVFDYFEDKYFNQNDEMVSKVIRLVIRTERQAARKKGKYKQIELPHPWTDEELKALEEEVLSEEIRGANPRYWEDVNVGDDLKPVVKGPLGLTDIVAMCVAGLAPAKLMAHGASLREYRKKPAWAFRDINTHALEPIYAVHYNKQAANAMGVPFSYDVGTQRHCWQIHLLTNWMGDDGFLKRSKAEYRKFVCLSEAVRISGKVTKKYTDEEGEFCVDVETHAINQRGEDVMPGEGTIALPSREKDLNPIAKRLG
ncbi:MAG: MaoC family dehydratase N-terminal domain-containing protein [Thermodesulfobacteriota bacterium]|nr:MaoC family dehydratase N-terminal domain-containing protein [Thermodesulfobacteriota bacterium]